MDLALLTHTGICVTHYDVLRTVVHAVC
jgi:hypothetical protein